MRWATACHVRDSTPHHMPDYKKVHVSGLILKSREYIRSLLFLPVPGSHYNAMDNRNGGHLLSSGATREDEHTFHEQASNRERELHKELDATKKELEEERERMGSNEAELQLALSGMEQEVCEYKNQLMLVKNTLENEHREWETLRARLESQIERERLNVRSRDVEIHELKLSKEQETAALSTQLVSVRNQLEAENRLLREQLRQFTIAQVDNQPTH